MITLAPFLRDKGLLDGTEIISTYQSLDGEQYVTRWTIMPLQIAKRVYTEQKGIEEIAQAAEQIAKAVDGPAREFRVSTYHDRLEKDRRTSEWWKKQQE